MNPLRKILLHLVEEKAKKTGENNGFNPLDLIPELDALAAAGIIQKREGINRDHYFPKKGTKEPP